ncbi:hypothetical protein MSAN_00390300 [Mycena sanguinolenta]|uniref:F-box domain-containing protein n=1 Tax=Mycena sanguinolenta TaxID=230812 RepID=A0A8H7DJ03_9AGAR|nr:hypothetical protein MSAN_00390300 [Mycena sanguinolenta]
MLPTNRAQSRVLDIPELLDMIFAFLDETSVASTASVCKRWSEIALDTLWRDLADLHRLFGILRALKQTGDSPDSPYAFTAAPDADDWGRLEKYTRRVRRLTYHYQTPKGPCLCPTVFEDVARTRTSLNILPNLKTLVWNAPPPLAVIFMQPTVKHFTFWLPETIVQDESHLPFFRDVVSRMPHLTTLDIRTNIPMGTIEDSMIFLFGLTKLRKVILPRFSVTTRIAQALQHLEDLGCLEFQYCSDQGCGDPADIESSSPTNLTALYVDSRLIESPAALHELLTVLADTCQLLESLGIVTHVDDTEPLRVLADVPSEERINSSTLQPLQNFPNLTIFEITHQYPLDLKLADLERLARSWPSLRKLMLNNEPVVSDECSLTLEALIPFAKHCPELEQLGLFVNASTAELPLKVDLSPSPQFKKLRRLSMGVSRISDPGPVALFLSQICPLNIYLESGITWEIEGQREQQQQPPLLQTISNRCGMWAKVEELLPLLTKLRMEERERSRLLVAEVQDLRMRCGVLTDKLAAIGGRSGESCVTL